jgi:hypothetical protein
MKGLPLDNPSLCRWLPPAPPSPRMPLRGCALQVYLGRCGVRYAKATGESEDNVISRFNGMVCWRGPSSAVRVRCGCGAGGRLVGCGCDSRQPPLPVAIDAAVVHLRLRLCAVLFVVSV